MGNPFESPFDIPVPQEQEITPEITPDKDQAPEISRISDIDTFIEEQERSGDEQSDNSRTLN